MTGMDRVANLLDERWVLVFDNLNDLLESLLHLLLLQLGHPESILNVLLDAILVRHIESDMQKLQRLVPNILVEAEGSRVVSIECHITGEFPLLWLLTWHNDFHLKSVCLLNIFFAILEVVLFLLFFNQILLADLVEKLYEHSQVLPVVRLKALVFFHFLVGEYISVVLPDKEVVLVTEELNPDVVGLLVCAPD